MFATKETSATLTNMKTIMFDGLRDGQGIPQISRNVALSGLTPYTTKTPANAAELQKMVRYRSEMIARTETLRASNMGRMYAYKSRGVKQVEWLVADNPCPLCADHEGEVYDIDKAPVPPLHPLCRCAVSAVVP